MPLDSRDVNSIYKYIDSYERVCILIAVVDMEIRHFLLVNLVYCRH